MKKFIAAILAVFGIGLGASAQSAYKNVDVNGFEQLIKSDSVQLVDVRRLNEYKEDIFQAHYISTYWTLHF